MERLTKIDGIGQHDLIRCFDCDIERAGENLEHCGYCEEGWQRAVNRLAAYEETGLEPEEIKDILERYRGFRAAISDETGQPMVSWTRASKLVRADKEGRMVVLPCKAGYTMYSLVWNIKTERYDVHSGEVKNVRYDSADDTVTVSDGEYFRVLGKTVFLTRAEAEAAQREEGQDA